MERYTTIQHSVLCTLVFLLQDKNALRMRTGVAIASFTSAIDGFKERVAEKVALSQSVPFTSDEFHWDGKRWRMLLFVKPAVCKMYVQMRSAVSPVRVAIRYIDMSLLFKVVKQCYGWIVVL